MCLILSLKNKLPEGLLLKGQNLLRWRKLFFDGSLDESYESIPVLTDLIDLTSAIFLFFEKTN